VNESWRKSTRCESSGCVEVAEADGRVMVRDSTDPHGPVLTFSRQSWAAFVAAVRLGLLDGPGGS
jgi:hypothetical protein